jgi:hypothetical protein
MDLDDFEKAVMGLALAKGRVEHQDVMWQIDSLIKEKSLNASSWDVFNQTIAKLKKMGLLDEKNHPHPIHLSALPQELLLDGIYNSLKRTEELEKDLQRVDKEKLELQSKIYTLGQEKNQLTQRLSLLLPLPKRMKQELLEGGIDSYLGYELTARLSPTTKSDLEDAMKCLKCGIATPGAMISLRAAEDVVRKFYEVKFGEKSGKAGLKDVLDKLTERTDVDKTLMGYLQYIRSKRNEAEHPEKIFSQEEAEETFITVTNAIKEVHRQL